MKFTLALLTTLSLCLSAHAASFPYITLNGQTNRLSDNGTVPTYNGTPIGSNSTNTGNWLPSGTTNSTLTGTASTGKLIATDGTTLTVPADGPSALSLSQSGSDYAWTMASDALTNIWGWAQVGGDSLIVGVSDSTGALSTEGFELVADFGMKIDQGTGNNLNVASLTGDSGLVGLDGSGTLTIATLANWTNAAGIFTGETGKYITAAGTLATPSGTGNMVNTGTSVVGNIPVYTDTSGTALSPLGGGIANISPIVLYAASAGTGAAGRTNFLVGLGGYNANASGKLHTNDVAQWHQLETMWEAFPGQFQTEEYITYISPDNSVQYRPWSILVRTNGYSEVNNAVDNTYFSAPSNAVPFMNIHATAGTSAGSATLNGIFTTMTNSSNNGGVSIKGGVLDIWDTALTTKFEIESYDLGTPLVQNAGGGSFPLTFFNFTSLQMFNVPITFTSGFATSRDAGIARDSAGVVRITDGSTGKGQVIAAGAGSYAVSTITTAATGATNTLGVNVILYVTAATSAALTDNLGTNEFSGVTIAAFTPIRVQPGGKFTGTSITYATGTPSHAW